MFVSEYASIFARSGLSSKVANIFLSSPISPSLALVVIRRAAMPSRAAQTVIISRISRLVLRTTNTPRRCLTRTKPSCSNRVIASRIGVRLTPRSIDNWRSSRRNSSRAP